MSDVGYCCAVCTAAKSVVAVSNLRLCNWSPLRVMRITFTALRGALERQIHFLPVVSAAASVDSAAAISASRPLTMPW